MEDPNEYVIMAKRIFHYTILEGISIPETVRRMKEEGINIDEKTVGHYKENVFKLLQNRNAQEEVRQFALDSIEIIKSDYDYIRNKLREIVEEAKDNNTKVGALRTLLSSVELGVKRLEGFKEKVLSIKNYYTIQQVGEIVNKGRNDWFKMMEAAYSESDNMIVFRKPTPEAIEAVRKWKSAEV